MTLIVVLLVLVVLLSSSFLVLFSCSSPGSSSSSSQCVWPCSLIILARGEQQSLPPSGACEFADTPLSVDTIGLGHLSHWTLLRVLPCA